MIAKNKLSPSEILEQAILRQEAQLTATLEAIDLRTCAYVATELSAIQARIEDLQKELTRMKLRDNILAPISS